MLSKFWLYFVAAASVISAAGGYQAGSHIEGIKAAVQIAAVNDTLSRATIEHNQTVSELEAAIGQANAAIEVAKAQSSAADAARALAVRHAEEMADQSRSREQRLDESTARAKGCEEVLSNYWEMRR